MPMQLTQEEARFRPITPQPVSQPKKPATNGPPIAPVNAAPVSGSGAMTAGGAPPPLTPQQREEPVLDPNGPVAQGPNGPVRKLPDKPAKPLPTPKAPTPPVTIPPPPPPPAPSPNTPVKPAPSTPPILLPAPKAPVATPNPAPAPTAPSPIPVYEPERQKADAPVSIQKIDPNNDLRNKVITPITDKRLSDAQMQTDHARNRVASLDPLATMAGQESRYKTLFGDGRVNYTGAGTDVNFTGVDPNVAWKGANTTVQAGPDVGVEASEDLKRYRGLLGTATDSLVNLPDRAALARSEFDRWAADTDPVFQASLRDAARYGANTGNLGSGKLRTSYGDLALNRTRDLESTRARLIDEAVKGTIDDRFRTVDSVAGVAGQTAAEEAGIRGEQRQDRDYRTNVDTGNVERGISERNAELGLTERNRTREIGERDTRLGQENTNLDRQRDERAFKTGIDQYNQESDFARKSAAVGAAANATAMDTDTRFRTLDDLAGLESQLFAENQGIRNEYRGERTYQAGQAQQSIQNRVQQLMMELQAQNQKFNQGVTMTGLGFEGNPSGTYMAGSNAAGGTAQNAFSGLANSAGIDSLIERLRAAGLNV